mgnify:CR=1 FL=1
MVAFKRKKNTRQRGSHTHGWGAMKKHRGSGNRGGVGMAGSGKRADQKKPSLWKKPYFGKFGFIKKNQLEVIPVTLRFFEEHADKLVKQGKITKEGNFYVVDVEKLGYNKVIGNFKLTKKLKIKSPMFSKGALTDIEKAGGIVQKEEQ